jgi:ATP-dependent RNA helicase DDX24/MAK5
MSSKDYAHLNDLSQVRYLVIDEADRMVKQGSFPQLSSILDALQRANPMDDDDSDDEGELDLDSEMDQNRLLGLPGIRGEARVQMLTDDILKQIEAQRTGEKPAAKEVHDDEGDEEDDEVDSETEDISLPLAPPVQRLTFVYSATLTLPASDKYVSTKKHKKDRSGVEGAIAEILERAHAKGKTKVVDLSSGNKIDSSTPKKEVKAEKSKKKEPKERKQFQLPPGLILQQIKCTQKHKDSHLYAYLTTTDEGSAGPCLVFCNSIAGVRRVGTTLQTLGVDVRILHAKMQQVRFELLFSSDQWP